MASRLKLDDDQMFALMKFKKNVQDVLQPHHNERFLCRWLRARQWDVPAAEKMFRDSMIWRKQWEVDTRLKTWTAPEPVASCYPSGCIGLDKEKHPVYVVPMGNLDIVGYIHSTSKQDLIRLTIKILEETLDIAHKNGRTEVVAIFDLDNFNLKQFAWKPAIEIVITLLQMYETNYPEILKICYIINAPRLFAMAYNLLKKVINEYTQSKIKIFKPDPKKWKPALQEHIHPDNLPVHYGGNMVDAHGDPKCSSIIRPGKKVPKEFYKKNLAHDDVVANKEFITETIKKGKKLSLDFLVVDEGCCLQYDFRTEAHDIKFGITCTDEEGKTHPVIRHGRTAANLIDVTGTIACKAPATYTVNFDNSYSLFRNKVIHYSVYISGATSGVADALNNLQIDTSPTDVATTLNGFSNGHDISATNGN